ncbi:MAG TPA: hypothetical protein VK028_02845 [Micromonosporaceae bacterium]|nr:hypothetical protein [Micromonosporaceae bacterium]
MGFRGHDDLGLRCDRHLIGRIRTEESDHHHTRHPKIATIMKGKRFLGADHDLRFMIADEGGADRDA